MRKLLIVIAAIAALGGGYTAYWFTQADVIRKNLVRTIDNLNAQAKQFTKDKDLVHFESIRVTGFPLGRVIEMSKPVITIPASALIEEFQRQKGVTKALPFEWVEEIRYGDKMTIVPDLLFKNFTYTIFGAATQKSLVNGTPRHTVNMSFTAPPVCHFSVHEYLKNLQSTLESPEAFLAFFRSFDCNFQGYTLKDGSGNLLLSSDGYSFSAGNEKSANGSHKLAFKADLLKMKATPAFDVIVNDYTLMFYTLMGQPEKAAAGMTPPSQYGERNIDMDVAYDGPITKSGLTDKNANLHFDINQFNFQSALSTVTGVMHLSAATQGKDRAVSVSLHETLESTERGEQITKKYLAGLLADLRKNPSADIDPAQQFLNRLAALGAPEATVEKLYPQLHTLGKAAFDLDLHLRLPGDGKPALQGSLTLDDFDLLSSLYGLKVTGAASMDTPGKPPTADFSITCIACDALVNDTGNYAMRIESAIDQASKPPKQPFLNQGLIDGAKQFLRGISENAAARDLVIHIIKGDTGFTISGKQLADVLQIYMATLAPRMPPPPPPADAQPELSSPPLPKQ